MRTHFSFIRNLVLPLILGSVLAGCATRQPYVHSRIPFPVEEYASYAATGNSTVSGTAVIERYNAAVSNPRNPMHNLMLLPITSYSQQAHDIAYLPCFRIAPPDPRQEQYVRRLPPIANGSFEVAFEFKNVPAGKYWVLDRALYDVNQAPDYEIDGVRVEDKGFRVRIARVEVEPGKDVTNVKVAPPPDGRNGGSECFTFQ